MADYNVLKAAIADYVKDRTGLSTIDGDGLQETLMAMVNSLGANYQFADVATPSTSPGTPDQNVFYIAAEPGTYTNFPISGGYLQVAENEVAIFKYNGQWSKETTGAATAAQVTELGQATSISLLIESIRTSQVIKKRWDVNIEGGYISKFNGTLVEAEGYYYSDYIPCLPGQQIYCNIDAPSSLGICFYNKNKEFISGYNVSAGNTIATPANAFFVRASSGTAVRVRFIEFVSDDKSLQDIPGKRTSHVWIQNSNTSADNIDYTFIDDFSRRDVYNTFRFVRLHGFDKTKKHTCYVIWNKTNIFSYRITEYNETTQQWEVVFYYLNDSYTHVKQLYFDQTYNGKRVETFFDFGDILISAAIFNNLTDTPEYIFAKECYVEDIVAGDGIKITNGVVSFDDVNAKAQKIVLDGEIETFSVKDAAFSISGFIQLSSGLPTAHSTYYCTDFLPCVPGQKYLTNTQQYSAAAICFYNANKVYSNQYYQHAGSGVAIFTVPTGAYFMRLSCAGGISNRYATLQNSTYVGLKQLTTDVKKLNVFDNPFNVPIKLYPQTKLPVISFQFDDNPLKDQEVVDLFKQYHLTCAFAFIASESNILEHGPRYLEYQKQGFQIMSHSVDGTIFNTTNYTYQTAMAAILTAKQRIEAAGMICNGFVSPSSSMDESFLSILKLAHAYAFTTATSDPTANSRTQDTCQLHRYSLESYTLAEIESFIDSCISNDQIITLYGHAGALIDDGDTSVWSLAKIAAIIEYCIAKRNAGLLWMGGTDECVKYFFGL